VVWVPPGAHTTPAQTPLRRLRQRFGESQNSSEIAVLPFYAVLAIEQLKGRPTVSDTGYGGIQDAVPPQRPPQQQAYPVPAPGYYGQPPAYQQPAPYPVPMIAPKSPGVAVLASFFLPGLGSMISGNGGIGTLIMVLYFVSWALTVILIGFIGVFAFWIWGMVQAYSDAVSWNRNHGIIS
jgi:TM2 domain-containing membrane protein YozV